MSRITVLVTRVEVYEVPLAHVDTETDWDVLETEHWQERRVLYSHQFVGVPADVPDLVINGPQPDGGLRDEAIGTAYTRAEALA